MDAPPPQLPPKVPQSQEGSPGIKPAHWDIGWAPLIVGALVLCAIYLVAVDSGFAASLKEGLAAAAGHSVAGLLVIPIGALVGLPIWFFAWLIKGRERVSFKPFVLCGMTAFLLIGSAGRQYVESVRTDTLSEPPRIDYAKERAIELVRHAKTWHEWRDNESVIQESLGKMTGDLKVLGWDATDYGNGTYLVRYSFVRDGESRAWHLGVNTRAEIVRDVSKDESLRKKYGFKATE